ncbi:BMC domain-containing protein [Azonexus sp. IMCC34839]|uniref:BMC domain-containing protein n=1 Tax=Azonexus sp. IMCC34839 TaxID=3133695 RepID=UPI003999C1DD
MLHAIGLIETNSIAKGIEASDVMAKTANVSILVSKAICPGKYIVMIGGDVAAVQQSVKAAIALAAETAVDDFIIPSIHPSIMPAISGGNSIGEVRAAGVIETYSVASCIEAADAAVKAASVEPVRMHLAFGIGGKSYVVLTGEVADVEAAVKAGCEVAGDKGMLVQRVVIPRPHKQVVEHLL